VDHFITNVIVHYGYLAIFLLMVAESACIPIPSEVIMLFGGAVAAGAIVGTEHNLDFVAVGLAGTLGDLTGASIAYWAGRLGGRPLVERFGRFILVRPHDLDRAEAWFGQHGNAAVFFGRLIPVVRTFISVPAGVAEMPFGRFALYTFAGALPWTFALAAVGYALGTQWETVQKYFLPITIVVAVLIAAAIAWWVMRRLRTRAEPPPRPAPEAPGTMDPALTGRSRAQPPGGPRSRGR
jgi:membrane protein DedA with SNARE-associated domain